MSILVINCGSSSLKYQLLDMINHQVLASGLVERIGLEDAILTHKIANQTIIIDKTQQLELNQPIINHEAAVKLVIDTLIGPDYGVIDSLDSINAIGHRVVHGGELYAQSVLINDEVVSAIESCIKLAPLHNPANLVGIQACQKNMPNTPMVAVFDTAFHQTMPEEAYMYGLPFAVYRDYKVRRYGFHGTSHKYVANKAAEYLGVEVTKLKLITCHLGNGASIAAIKYGQSIDTSMGFTPLAGLVMGTRCGDIDPSILNYLAQEMNLSLAQLDNIMNKESGMLGISGISNDFRDINNAANLGNQRAQLALKMYVYHVVKYIGSYVAAMNGVDAIVFTAGVGENDMNIRAQILNSISFLGVEVDEKGNDVRGQISQITTVQSKVVGLLVPTNEELMIALETAKILD